jgi:hypothetical protein
MAPIGQRSASGPNTPVKSSEHQADDFLSADVDATRSLMVSNISRKTSGKELTEFFDVSVIPYENSVVSPSFANPSGLGAHVSFLGPVLIDLTTSGIIYVGFTDIRDCQSAFHKARKLRTEWATHYLPSNQFDMKRDPGSTFSASAYEGQVTVRAHYGGLNHRSNTGTIRTTRQGAPR